MQTQTPKIFQNRKGGLAGIWHNYDFLPFWSWRENWPMLYSLVGSAIVLVFNGIKFKGDLKAQSDFIFDLVSNALSMLPSLIGFSLTAFTVLASMFLSSEGFHKAFISEKIFDDPQPEKTSGQKAMAIFGWAILAQIVLIAISTFLKFIGKIEVVFNHIFSAFTNYLLMAVLEFLIIYSIFLLLSIVGNLFSLFQLTHFHVLIGKFSEKNKQGNGRSNPNP